MKIAETMDEMEVEEDTDNLVDDLLNEEVPTIDGLFGDPEQKEQITQQLVQEIVGLWANNNHLIRIVTRPGYARLLKEYLTSPEVLQPVGPAAQLLLGLVDQVQFDEAEEVPFIMFDTIRKRIEFNEVSSVKAWDDQFGLTKRLSESGLTLLPDTRELRLLAMFNALLNIRESGSKIVIPGTSLGRLPMPGN